MSSFCIQMAIIAIFPFFMRDLLEHWFGCANYQPFFHVISCFCWRFLLIRDKRTFALSCKIIFLNHVQIIRFDKAPRIKKMHGSHGFLWIVSWLKTPEQKRKCHKYVIKPKLAQSILFNLSMFKQVVPRFI